jgi:hypothetical protein
VKKLFSILFALVLVVSLGLVTAAPVLADGTIIHVPGDYDTIQEAIDAASDGDTIMVAAGEYEAFQVVDKTNIGIISAEEATVTTAGYFSIGVEPIENAWVMAAVKDSQNINIEGIDFDGTGVIGKDMVVGIAYVDSTGRIDFLTVANITGAGLGAGVAIIGEVGIYCSEVGMKGSTISDNGKGIYVCGNFSLEAHFNNIVGNSLFGAFNYGGAWADATYNWWGDVTGPYHETLNPDGTGDRVSDGVGFEHWLEAEVATETLPDGGIFDARDSANTQVLVSGNNASVTVAQYPDNPGGDPPANNFVALDNYIDVCVTDTEGINEIEIRLYYTDAEVVAASVDEESLRLSWWDGSAWVVCSPSNVSTDSIYGYSGYIWAKIRASGTTPRLADLQGTPFGGYGHPPTTPTQGCFIATAAYGTNTAKELDILREFRDEVLLPNSLGTMFVSLYYKTSPPIADFISQHEVLRIAVRVGFVDPIVKILNWSHDLWSARVSQ